MATAMDIEGIKTSRVSPKFLHGNSTSHTWLFSAFAELIDNAYDPDVTASEIWIDVRKINNNDCITFVDNGNGMTPDKLYKMLSFGYCEKVTVGNVKPIGFYGNGFKSGSMRIGKDALVFTRSINTMSVGMLSQTYLNAINAEAVIVPIVTFDLPSKLRQNSPESLANMKAIMKYSIFQSEHQLISELKALEKMHTGTNIIIYNLKRDKSGNYEIDFESDKYDLRNPETQMIDLTSINRPINQSSPEYKRSLREYCSILYLKPRMKIVIRGRKVATKLISKSLSKTETDVYKPSWLPRPVRLTFGFTNRDESENYGLMMYHKNRLIRAYEKIGCQKQANNHGIGVVGVVEANFLEPIHNKQDFNRTDRYSAFMQNISLKLNDYFYEKTQNENPDRQTSAQQVKLPDWTWAQCDNCLSWRRLPTGYNENLPDKWYCRMNPDAAFNRCDIPEEPEDDDEALQRTYRKTYKKTADEKRRQAKLEEERRLQEKEEQLQKKEKLLKKQMKQIAKQNQELEEVSSTQDKVDRKPTVRDLVNAQKSISAYQQKMKEKEQTIQQLELQKKKIEEQSQAMLRMAESLKLSTVQGSEMYEKIQEISGLDSSTVTSSSGSSTGLRAPKRKHDMVEGDNTEGEPNEKIVKIKTEDGGTVPVKIVETGQESIIDLTLDEDEFNATTSVPDNDTREESESVGSTNDKSGDEQGTSGNSAEMEDTKPDKEELDKKIAEANKTKKSKLDKKTEDKNIGEILSETRINDETTKADDKLIETSQTDEKGTEISKSDENLTTKPEEKVGETDDKQSEMTKTDEKQTVTDKKAEIKTDKEKDTVKCDHKNELVDKHSQTVPTIVKFASPEEVELLKLSPVEQKEALLLKARELDDTKKCLASLQDNIWKLLKIIVPDFDYGEPDNIEKIILDFIRVNEEQDSQDT